MKKIKEKARSLLEEFKRGDYVFGVDCLERVGELVFPLGRKTLLITNLKSRSKRDFSLLIRSLNKGCEKVIGPVKSAKPNAPREDVLRLVEEIKKASPDNVVVVAGGSGIDAAKAADILAVLGGDVEDYFGVGRVSDRIECTGRELLPLIAVQTASSSAAHLTKYSNITDLKTSQKKLIVDEAIVPPKALFDYSLTRTMPPALTMDGAFDGMAHCLEVFYGAPPELFKKIGEVAETGLELIIPYLERAVIDGQDLESREALGLGTDLGGYAIMLGGTSGPHLTSFSFVDILSHGRACTVMMPYYTVFFASAIRRQIQILVRIYAKFNLVSSSAMRLEGRDLAQAVAEGMVRLAERLGFPSKLNDIQGFEERHIQRALQAAKNPHLEMKLKNMPVPLTREMVDDYMGSILEAAKTGDFSLIKKAKKS
jgi:alcohol dehydrogenase